MILLWKGIFHLETHLEEDNVITIIYEPYDALQKDLYIELEELVYKIDELTEVKDVLSLFSLSDIDLNAWIGDLYNENTRWNKDTVLQKLKYIQADPSIGARVLSKDLKYGAIILTLSDRANNHKDRTDLIEKIKIFTEQTSPDWIFSGVSVLRTEYVKYMLRDNIVFLPPIALILISILSYIFRSWVFVLLPIMTVIITVIWLLGFMGLVGLEINIMTYVVPTLLFIIGISDAIHIQARFRENMSKDNSDPEKAMFLLCTDVKSDSFDQPNNCDWLYCINYYFYKDRARIWIGNCVRCDDRMVCFDLGGASRNHVFRAFNEKIDTPFPIYYTGFQIQSLKNPGFL